MELPIAGLRRDLGRVEQPAGLRLRHAADRRGYTARANMRRTDGQVRPTLYEQLNLVLVQGVQVYLNSLTMSGEKNTHFFPLMKSIIFIFAWI